AAVQLGSSAGAFKKTLERARDLLRSRLARRGLVLSAAVAALLSGNGAQAAIGPALVQGTAQAALRFVTGKGTAGGASAAAVTLAEGALRAMHKSKWATALLALMALTGLGTGLGLWTYQLLRAESPSAHAAAAGAGQLQPPAVQPKEAAGQKTDQERLLGT